MATVKKVKKAQRGGCVSNMSGAQRQRYFQSAYGPSPLQKAGQAIKNVFSGGKTKEERQEARAEKKAARAAKKSVPGAKYGKSVVKKAQDGKALRNTKEHEKNRKQSTALTEMGKKTTRAAIDKRTDEMAKSLDKASVFGKNYVAPGDSAKKKAAAKKLAPKKKMKHGGTVSMQLGSYGRQPGKNYTGKAKSGTSVGKCKYGC
jgi:hypothetical protein